MLSREAGGHLLAALKEGLAQQDWKEGTQYVIEERWANAELDRLQGLAEEIAGAKPAIIVAFPTLPVKAAAKAAPFTPIVSPTGDLVASGIVKNLAHPGGMVTGISNVVTDFTEKHLELLMAISPNLRHVGFLADASGGLTLQLKEAAHRSAARFSVEEAYEHVTHPEEIEPAIRRLAEKGSEALIVLGSPILISERRRILSLAESRRWPVAAWSDEWPRDGALFSYGGNTPANFKRAADYIDKILKGTEPGDLPIEQPTKFELVVNLRTAKALGLPIPQQILVRTDEVIE